MRKFFGLVLVAVMLVSFSGCAFLFRGVNQQVALNANTAGAEVWIDGVKVGVTPLKLSLKPDKSYTVTFKKAGFKDKTYLLQNRIGVLWVVLDLLATGLIPLVVDAVTGAWWEFESTDVSIVLDPATLNHGLAPRDYSWFLLNR